MSFFGRCPLALRRACMAKGEFGGGWFGAGSCQPLGPSRLGPGPLAEERPGQSGSSSSGHPRLVAAGAPERKGTHTPPLTLTPVSDNTRVPLRKSSAGGRPPFDPTHILPLTSVIRFSIPAKQLAAPNITQLPPWIPNPRPYFTARQATLAGCSFPPTPHTTRVQERPTGRIVASATGLQPTSPSPPSSPSPSPSPSPPP